MVKLSKKTLAAIDKGMEQSQEGKVVDRGTFKADNWEVVSGDVDKEWEKVRSSAIKTFAKGIAKEQTRIGIRGLDPELYRQARLKAVSRNVNVAEIINDALRDYISKQETTKPSDIEKTLKVVRRLVDRSSTYNKNKS